MEKMLDLLSNSTFDRFLRVAAAGVFILQLGGFESYDRTPKDME